MKIDSGFLIAIVIGIALCILVNRVFMVEGVTGEKGRCDCKFPDKKSCNEPQDRHSPHAPSIPAHRELCNKYTDTNQEECETNSRINEAPIAAIDCKWHPGEGPRCDERIKSFQTNSQVNDCLLNGPGCVFEHNPIFKNKCKGAPQNRQEACANAFDDAGKVDVFTESFCRSYGAQRGLNCGLGASGNNCVDKTD